MTVNLELFGTATCSKTGDYHQARWKSGHRLDRLKSNFMGIYVSMPIKRNKR